MPTKTRKPQAPSDRSSAIHARTVNAVLTAVRQAANVLCDRWSLLTLLLAHTGVSRYQDFSQRGGMASRMLTSRLELLEQHEIMVRVAYTRRPPRYDYFLSHMGLGLFNVFATMARWESTWHPSSPATNVRIEHLGCGERAVLATPCCAKCNLPLAARDIRLSADRGQVKPIPHQTQFRRSTLTATSPGLQDRIPLAHAIDVFGDKWGIGVVMCLFMRVRTFSGFQEHLGISTNILADRLARLANLGILRPAAPQDGPTKAGYLLTDKGIDLYPILLAMETWADNWLRQRYRSPVKLVHRQCQNLLAMRVDCDQCGKPMARENCRLVLSEPG